MQKIRLSKDEVDRYLEDWGAVVAFRRDGGVGYPVSDAGGGSNARAGSSLSRTAERYLHVERMMEDVSPLVRVVADALYVRGVQTVEEYARQACGKDKVWAMGLAWLANEFWQQFRSKMRESLSDDVDWSVMDRARSAVARPVALDLPGYGQITEADRRAAMAAGWRP